jgi:Cyclic-phosphate processing Receiver domain
MKIWLDDERPAPDGWVCVETSADAIRLLETNPGHVEALSLDHDLGGDDTGYLVIAWLEERVALDGFAAPVELRVHSANPVGRARMQQTIDSIRRLEARRGA